MYVKLAHFYLYTLMAVIDINSCYGKAASILFTISCDHCTVRA